MVGWLGGWVVGWWGGGVVGWLGGWVSMRGEQARNPRASAESRHGIHGQAWRASTESTGMRGEQARNPRAAVESRRGVKARRAGAESTGRRGEQARRAGAESRRGIHGQAWRAGAESTGRCGEQVWTVCAESRRRIHGSGVVVVVVMVVGVVVGTAEAVVVVTHAHTHKHARPTKARSGPQSADQTFVRLNPSHSYSTPENWTGIRLTLSRLPFVQEHESQGSSKLRVSSASGLGAFDMISIAGYSEELVCVGGNEKQAFSIDKGTHTHII